MNMTDELIPTHIFEAFTEDAQQLLKFYFDNIQAKFKEGAIGHKTYRSVIDGMISYVADFIDEESTTGLISYKKTLGLIDELGTPTEIIAILQIRDLNEIPSKMMADSSERCHWCGFFNQRIGGKYCENCGNLMNTQPVKGGQGLRQFTIDHPYQMIFLTLYTSLLIVVVVMAMINDPGLGLGNAFARNIWIPIFPSLVIAFIVGYIIESAYKDSISLEQKYEQAVEEYDEPILFYLFAPFLAYGPLLGIIAILTQGNQFMDDFGYPLFGTSIGILFLIQLLVMLIKNVDQEPKIEEIDYHTIKSLKKVVDKEIGQQVKEFLPTALRNSAALAVLIVAGVNFVFELSIYVSIVFGLGLIGYSFVHQMAVYSLYHYSWAEIRKNYLEN